MDTSPRHAWQETVPAARGLSAHLACHAAADLMRMVRMI